jgi:hypothetical protein
MGLRSISRTSITSMRRRKWGKVISVCRIVRRFHWALKSSVRLGAFPCKQLSLSRPASERGETYELTNPYTDWATFLYDLSTWGHSYLRWPCSTFSQGPQINKTKIWGIPRESPLATVFCLATKRQNVDLIKLYLFTIGSKAKKWFLRTVAMHFLQLKADWLIRGDP